MKGIFILLGSNMGEREENLKRAIELLKSENIGILKTSSVYETEPWGKSDQDWFLNMVLEIQTPQSAKELLKICQHVEQSMGRRRIEKWGARIIDIDILYYYDQQIDSKELQVPHPGIAMRRFTLMPLNEIAPNQTHPILNLTQAEMLNVCPDELDCRKISLKLSL